MISAENMPANRVTDDSDFTTEHYRRLLVLAKNSYLFASYSNIPWGTRFILWRHDCDFSLNRALALAKIEAQVGVHATYFLNPHCEFYNLFEKSQYTVVKEILALGHDIGLHFDAAFYDIASEQTLSTHVRNEADLLHSLFGIAPSAFSFHNPVASHLSCEAEEYGGLTNCYSRRFKADVPYCSDSNGYWRFRRLPDVLEQAVDPCLQVLTHPDWWQSTAMPPRQRIFRSIYGRARASMRLYDDSLERNGRQNLAGPPGALAFLRSVEFRTFELCDLLWNRGEFSVLFEELFRWHEVRVRGFCHGWIGACRALVDDKDRLQFDYAIRQLDAMSLAELVFDLGSQELIGPAATQYAIWRERREQLRRGEALTSSTLEDGCTYLCKVIECFEHRMLTLPVVPADLILQGSFLDIVSSPDYPDKLTSLLQRLQRWRTSLAH